MYKRQRFVLITDALRQLPSTAFERGLSRYFRVGPAIQPHDAETFRTVERTFKGVGLRPYAPAHLRAKRSGDDVNLSWVRRTRFGGDDWEIEPPLNEETERYRVTVEANGETRTEETSETSITLIAPTSASITVAQVSAQFGPGLGATIAV